LKRRNRSGQVWKVSHEDRLRHVWLVLRSAANVEDDGYLVCQAHYATDLLTGSPGTLTEFPTGLGNQYGWERVV